MDCSKHRIKKETIKHFLMENIALHLKFQGTVTKLSLVFFCVSLKKKKQMRNGGTKE